jgi:hypothetical protein
MKSNIQDWSSIEKFAFDYWTSQLANSSVLQDLPVDIQRDWNNASLRDVDNFLKKYCTKITCSDVSAIYWKFWWDLKKIKSNSTNFVGYSEFIVLRLLLHYLNERYYCNALDSECESIPNPDSPSNDLGYFVLGNKELFVATECIPKVFKADLGKRRPDIILYKDRPDSKLIAIVQVKSYPASAANVKSDLRFFDFLNKSQKYENARGLVMIFYGCIRLHDPRICKLWDNPTAISEVFRRNLNLDQLKKP